MRIKISFMCQLKNSEPKFYAGPWRCLGVATGALSGSLAPTVSYVSPFCIVIPPQGEGKVTFVEVPGLLGRNCNKFCVDSPAVMVKTNYLCVRKTDDLQ